MGAILIASAVASVAGGCGRLELSPGGDAGSLTAADASADRDAADDDRRMSVVIVCGNGVVDPGEQCDDGNRSDGDGCSSACQVECSWVCGTRICGPGLGRPCVVKVVCGDGVRNGDEVCDDGNQDDGDGCSADCLTVEMGWRCRVPGRACAPICGDGLIVGGEACDDGDDLSGDGCSSACLKEPTTLVCGDGIVSGAEECDQGLGNGDPLNPCRSDCTYGPICGDAIVQGDEECDLGAGNGGAYGAGACTSACKRAPYCGDGVVDPGEGCDLGAAQNGRYSSPCTVNCTYVLP